MASMKLAAFAALQLCVCCSIAGFNAVYVAKVLADASATSLPDVTRRIGNAFFYFGVVGAFAAAAFVNTFVTWRARTKEPNLNRAKNTS